ncbi:mucin-17 isoform X2 [Hyalella azteca]|uniref:Mucin-17 isoform X2 n=1 Tax=Hyalella azteca TaxID=294128 RepID=A0A8B7PH72_HYAAZ|nr:mucin-17 isoform X2 [Hyalella azteca]
MSPEQHSRGWGMRVALLLVLVTLNVNARPPSARILPRIPLDLWFGSSGGSSLGITDAAQFTTAQQQTTTTLSPTLPTQRTNNITPTENNNSTTESMSTQNPVRTNELNTIVNNGNTTTTTSTENPVRTNDSTATDDNEEVLAPYIAFNIWSYDNGELKLSAVKKVLASEVLGMEFYSKITENPNNTTFLLSDSLVFSGQGPQTSTALPITTEIDNESPTPSVQNSTTFMDALAASVGELGLSSADRELLEHLLNSANTIPQTFQAPINNLFDFVSYIVDGSPATDVSTQFNSEMTSPDLTAARPVISTEELAIMPPKVENLTTIVEKVVSTESSPVETLSNVVISPEGVQIFNETQGLPEEAAVAQFISHLDEKPLILNINQSNLTQVMKISLLSDDGVPIDSSLLQNANLISIISNKPTIVNNNIYQILQSESQQTIPILRDSSSTSRPVINTSTIFIQATTNDPIAPTTPLPPTSPTSQDKKKVPSLTPEEQLFLELEKITSFNKILNGGLDINTLSDLSALETLALKGILDSKPELLNVAKKSSSISSKVPVVVDGQEADEEWNDLPDPASNVHTLQLDVLPLDVNGDSTVSQRPFEKNADLMVLESLLRERKLPKMVEREILKDITEGKTISDAILQNIDKYWKEISEHLKEASPLDDDLSPLAVIEDLEKKLTKENGTKVSPNETTTSHTFVTRVNVASPLADSKLPAKSENLQNCFQDRVCTFAFSIALAAGTTGALSVPFLTPVLGRSLHSSVSLTASEVPNELMSVEEARQIIAAVTKYSQRNGKTLRGDHVNLRRYMSPFVSYLGHKMFPAMFGGIPDK